MSPYLNPRQIQSVLKVLSYKRNWPLAGASHLSVAYSQSGQCSDLRISLIQLPTRQTLTLYMVLIRARVVPR